MMPNITAINQRVFVSFRLKPLLFLFFLPPVYQNR